MDNRFFGLAAAAILATALAGAARADVINIDSGPGNEEQCLVFATDTACETVAIDAHPLWQENGPEGSAAVWVSYADTGYQGDATTPDDSTDNPVFILVEEFEVASDSVLDFLIWADDTARVVLSGVDGVIASIDPNFSQNICADGSIGCEEDEWGQLLADLSAGSYQITMEIFQVGTGETTTNNPFGVLYTGTVSSVPEPGTLALLGMGMIGMGIARRRRRATSS
ncbi:PEP-CTERM sorting domain-containing protein [Lentisalinibacter sediminis]|uniref:PEP-CTERM sorting domain-containing protein n=1 Tax=Lentisalinibacter sediminis TaxID=2992237 RepID=UPI0038664629